jgi:hypothetical protein
VEEVIVRGFSPEEAQQFLGFLTRAVTNLEEDRKEERTT